MINLAARCCQNVSLVNRHPPTETETQRLENLYTDRGLLLADHIYKTMNDATDKLLDLEIELNAIESNVQPLPPRHTLYAQCSKTLQAIIRAKQTSIHNKAEKQIESTIAHTFKNIEQQFKTTVNAYELCFGASLKEHRHIMQTTILQLQDRQLASMKNKLTDMRLLVPFKTQGNRLSLVQLKFRMDGNMYFPPLAPLEVHFNCKLPNVNTP